MFLYCKPCSWTVSLPNSRHAASQLTGKAQAVAPGPHEGAKVLSEQSPALLHVRFGFGRGGRGGRRWRRLLETALWSVGRRFAHTHECVRRQGVGGTREQKKAEGHVPLSALRLFKTKKIVKHKRAAHNSPTLVPLSVSGMKLLLPLYRHTHTHCLGPCAAGRCSVSSVGKSDSVLYLSWDTQCDGDEWLRVEKFWSLGSWKSRAKGETEKRGWSKRKSKRQPLPTKKYSASSCITVKVSLSTYFSVVFTSGAVKVLLHVDTGPGNKVSLLSVKSRCSKQAALYNYLPE